MAKAAEDNKVNEMTFAKLQRAYSKAEAQETSLLADQTRISDTIAELVRNKLVAAANLSILEAELMRECRGSGGKSSRRRS